MTIVTTIITNTAALLRFTTRLSLHQTLGLDDLFMAGAVVSYGNHHQEDSSNLIPRSQTLYSFTSVYNVCAAPGHQPDDT
jgi:hypothetical protein